MASNGGSGNLMPVPSHPGHKRGLPPPAADGLGRPGARAGPQRGWPARAAACGAGRRCAPGPGKAGLTSHGNAWRAAVTFQHARSTLFVALCWRVGRVKLVGGRPFPSQEWELEIVRFMGHSVEQSGTVRFLERMVLRFEARSPGNHAKWTWHGSSRQQCYISKPSMDLPPPPVPHAYRSV
jgi:hypothetical protein